MPRTDNEAHDNSPSDETRLIASLRSGDAAAFETIFRAYAVPLCNVANSYLRSPDVSEEVVQELFTWLWSNRHEFAPKHGLKAYLFGAVRNRCLNVLRSEATADWAEASLSERMIASTRSADADLLALDLAKAVQATIDGMPPRCREVFMLIRTESLSYAEVASLLGIAPKTVEIHMSRALAILRARLGPWLGG